MVSFSLDEYVRDKHRPFWMHAYPGTPQGNALALLMRMLDDAQRESYFRSGHFDCTGSLGTRYRIFRGHVNNVIWVDNIGRTRGTLCAAPDQWPHKEARRPLPEEDLMLGQFLALVTDEKAFIRKANLDPGGRWPPCVRATWFWWIRSFVREMYQGLVAT